MMLEYFDKLTSLGIQVVPLWENSKRPMCKGWSENWDHGQSRRTLQVYPSANIGILLGEIVDVEGDSEQANRRILNLVRNYPHPSYKSQRSIHHLFQSPDPKLRILKRDNVEFRGHGHQSVLPPSQHQGTEYSWIKTTFPIPPMPPKLIEFYNRLKKRTKHPNQLSRGHKRAWCHKCRKKVILHEKRLELEQRAFCVFGLNWECNKCRDMDLRPICRRLKSNNVPEQLQ